MADITLDQAQAQMATVAKGIEQRHPGEQTGRSVKLVPIREQLTRSNRTSLLVLLGSVGCVLLIASANRAPGSLRSTSKRVASVDHSSCAAPAASPAAVHSVWRSSVATKFTVPVRSA